MKKFQKGLLIILSTALILTGCAKKSPSPSLDEPPKPTEEPKSPYYVTVMESDTRPIACMIDNDNSDAWPQAGIEDAYLIYEITVEGGASRMMALFKDKETEKIGPVRSSRHYFLDYVLEHDATYVHSGWSPKAQNDISTLKIDKINGVLSPDGKVFWRESKFAGDWHSLFTSMENIKSFAKEKGYKETTDKKVFKMAKQDAKIDSETAAVNIDRANKITVPYSGFYKVYYTYNPETKTYDRTMNKTDHITQGKARISPKNIIIQYADNYPLPGDSEGKRQEVDTVGSGKGYFISLGYSMPIAWEKASRSSKTVYKDVNGNEIVLNPGLTFVNIISENQGVVIEEAGTEQ